MSRDPIEEDGGLNLYGFVGNEPCGTLDVNGMNTFGPKDKATVKSDELKMTFDLGKAPFRNENIDSYITTGNKCMCLFWATWTQMRKTLTHHTHVFSHYEKPAKRFVGHPGVNLGQPVVTTDGVTYIVAGIFGRKETGKWFWYSKAEDPVYVERDIESEGVTGTGTIAVKKECHGLVDGRWAAKGECYLRKDEEDLLTFAEYS